MQGQDKAGNLAGQLLKFLGVKRSRFVLYGKDQVNVSGLSERLEMTHAREKRGDADATGNP